jgi:outer membrane murein-binding lipoprotein Lpp
VTSMNAEPGPNLADVLAAVAALATKVDDVVGGIASLDNKTDRIAADVGQLRTEVGVRFDMLAGDVSQLRADVLHAKGEAVFSEARARDAQTALQRHQSDPGAHGRAA